MRPEEATPGVRGGDRITLSPVGAHDWRDVAALEVTEAQRAFVAETTRYLVQARCPPSRAPRPRAAA